VTSPIAPRRRAVWDIVLSIVFLAVGTLTALVGGFFQLFIFAFTDDCPPATCHIDQATTDVFATWAIVAVVFLAAIVLTIVLLAQRRRAWWVALIGLIAVVVGGIVGFILYAGAVGYGL
jgi:uncharacterized BrkB/YihY/UPF0761 family membrane protein